MVENKQAGYQGAGNVCAIELSSNTSPKLLAITLFARDKQTLPKCCLTTRCIHKVAPCAHASNYIRILTNSCSVSMAQ